MSDDATKTAEAPEAEKDPGIKFTIDGMECTAKPGETILAAALRNGYEIPHYCWHPGLSIAGNCRMCLVFVEPGPPKPVIACSTEVREGMKVEHSSTRTKTAREGVMEFLLINHPLDCPICDQAGECDLQQYSFDHGRAESNFVEAKTQQHRKDFGPLIRFNGNRCIKCTRCVRFCQEVTESHELTVVNRSDHAVIDVFPGVPLDNPLSGCTADICPVGALLEKDSIHSTRVWLLRGTKSVCGGCATGCNINVETFNDQVQRLTPRENQAVNKWWMCDEGRLSHRQANDASRVRGCAKKNGEGELEAIGASQALDEAAAAAAGAKRVAVLATGFATNEELFLLDTLAGEGPQGVAYAPAGEAYRTRDGFHIAADKNPNREGAKRLLGTVGAGEKVQAALEAGAIDLLIAVDAVPGGAPWSEDLLAAVDKAGTTVVVSLASSPLAAKADLLFPAQHWTEKDGTYVNGRGRLQRLRAAISLPGDARTELDVLQELARAAGHFPRPVSAAGVFRRMAAATPAHFGGLDYKALGEYGQPLPGAADTTPAEECSTGYQAGPKSRGPGRALDEQVRIPVHRESAVYGTTQGDI